jgi:hypothetical protein
MKMGYRNAYEVKQLANLDVALRWHFEVNCYPPLPPVLLEPAKKAIELANANKRDEEIDLTGAGVLYKGRNSAPVWACVKDWFLQAFLEEN